MKSYTTSRAKAKELFEFLCYGAMICGAVFKPCLLPIVGFVMKTTQRKHGFDPNDEVLTRDEVCKLLKISTRTFYRLLDEKTAPPGRVISGHQRYLKSEVFEWMKNRQAVS